MQNSITSDFSTLFSYLWHNEFPLDGWNREHGSPSDWNIHTALTVRKTAELFGLFVHFESGNRTDAVIKDRLGTPVAFAEWEWQSPAETEINEPQKLSKAYTESKPQFCFLLTYTPENKLDDVLHNLQLNWQHSGPLLAGFITYEGRTYRTFKSLCFFEIRKDSVCMLRKQEALPWNVEGSKWHTKNNEQT